MGPITEGIIVGSTGGAFAGLAFWLAQAAHSKGSELVERLEPTLPAPFAGKLPT